MGASLRVPVRGWAASSLDIHAEEDWTGEDGDDGLAALMGAWAAGRRRALVFPARDADRILDGLTTLSNAEDERATADARRHPECARYARLSSLGLSAVSVRLCRVLRAAPLD